MVKFPNKIHNMEKDNTDKWLFLKITVKYQELYKTLESQAIGQQKKDLKQ